MLPTLRLMAFPREATLCRTVPIFPFLNRMMASELIRLRAKSAFSLYLLAKALRLHKIRCVSMKLAARWLNEGASAVTTQKVQMQANWHPAG